MSAGQQRQVTRWSYRLPSTETEDGDEEVIEEQEADTRQALYQYVFHRADRDAQLSRVETACFREAATRLDHEDVIPTPEGSSARMVGIRLAELGDQIDAMYGEELDDIVQLAGSPDEAFSSFGAVVKNVFDWDENGIPNLNIGRIAAVLGYCYHLCKTYVQRSLGDPKLWTFLGMIGSFLFHYFLKAKFYEWLQSQGGWGQLLAVTPTSWFGVFANKNAFLFVGLAFLAVYAFQYLRGR